MYIWHKLQLFLLIRIFWWSQVAAICEGVQHHGRGKLRILQRERRSERLCSRGLWCWPGHRKKPGWRRGGRGARMDRQSSGYSRPCRRIPWSKLWSWKQYRRVLQQMQRGSGCAQFLQRVQRQCGQQKLQRSRRLARLQHHQLGSLRWKHRIQLEWWLLQC